MQRKSIHFSFSFSLDRGDEYTATYSTSNYSSLLLIGGVDGDRDRSFRLQFNIY
jgi:hypothetical protein